MFPFNATLAQLHYERLQRREPQLERFQDLPEVYSLPGASLGSHTWGAAVAVARHVAAHPAEVHGQRVIELGAGTGLLGLTCAQSGAASVLLTDLEVNVPRLQRSVDHNRLGNIAQVRALDWSEKHPWLTRHDLVVMADVVYYDNAKLFEHLVDTVQECAGRVWLGYKERDGESEAVFFDLMRERHFRITEQRQLDKDHKLVIFCPG